MLNTPASDIYECSQDIPADPSLRFQTFGPNTCVPGKAIDDSSELEGLSYKNSKCSANYYVPGKYSSKGLCGVPGKANPRACMAPQESTRISNPPCTLKETGINRWDWICYDPQEKAIEQFDRIPVNYRMVAKDNHIPLIETPQDVAVFNPQKSEGVVTESNLNQWQDLNQKNKNYSPGYPYGEPNYLLSCKQSISTY
jgi:hypothetical protein